MWVHYGYTAVHDIVHSLIRIIIAWRIDPFFGDPLPYSFSVQIVITWQWWPFNIIYFYWIKTAIKTHKNYNQDDFTNEYKLCSTASMQNAIVFYSRLGTVHSHYWWIVSITLQLACSHSRTVQWGEGRVKAACLKLVILKQRDDTLSHLQKSFLHTWTYHTNQWSSTTMTTECSVDTSGSLTCVLCCRRFCIHSSNLVSKLFPPFSAHLSLSW